ncbi:MAG: preprotein translocase subunit SecG [Nitriliruptor sp.]
MSALTIFVIVLHVLLAGVLIMFVLLHRGQGGGLSDMFGGGSGGGLQGSAVVERNLDRLTVISALAFTVTNITLVIIY